MITKLLCWWCRKWYTTCEINFDNNYFLPMDIIDSGTNKLLCLGHPVYLPLPARSRLYAWAKQRCKRIWWTIKYFIKSK